MNLVYRCQCTDGSTAEWEDFSISRSYIDGERNNLITDIMFPKNWKQGFWFARIILIGTRIRRILLYWRSHASIGTFTSLAHLRIFYVKNSSCCISWINYINAKVRYPFPCTRGAQVVLHTFWTLAVRGGHPCMQRYITIKAYNVRYSLQILWYWQTFLP